MSLNIFADHIAPVLDSTNYPQRWADYVGQEDAVKTLKVAAKSAKIRKQPMDHHLITHPTPGIGKTALAHLISRELGGTCRTLSGAIGLNSARLLFSEMNDFDVLFYDECHQMMDGGKKNAEWWLTFLQDGIIPGPLGDEKQPRITVIAATTDVGKIPTSITDRFQKVTLREYTQQEATRIAQMLARSVLEGLPRLGPKDAAMIAAAGYGNPRRMRNLLRHLRDHVLAEELPLVRGRYDVAGLLNILGITEDGLDPMAQTYMRTLVTEFQNNAGGKSLEERLGQAGGLGEVERMLMDRGWLAKTARGRTLTQAGISRVRELLTA